MCHESALSLTWKGTFFSQQVAVAISGREKSRRNVLGNPCVASIRVSNADEVVGARALHVHAKDEGAKSFYEHFHFEQGLSDPLRFFALTQESRAVSPPRLRSQ